MDVPMEFLRFSSLPFQIRWTIYILATPPRIVHIRERTEDRELFEERLRTTSVQLNLDPTLVHFAHNWRSQIPHSNSGQFLEPDGSSDGGASNRPWEPSATPEIPLNWVVDNPDVAWELTRDSYLCSKAPIPALLHTCAESRMTLINTGYQLAFQTRSNEPRTWFHFDRDVPFISKNIRKLTDIGFKDEIHLLGKSPSSVGRFHPKDLKRVRKLALGGAAYFIEHTGSRSYSHQNAFNELANTIRLFSGISVLFLEGWAQVHIGHWTSPFSTYNLPCMQTTSKKIGSRNSGVA